MIRLLALGDIMGQPGRKVLAQGLLRARAELKPQIIIANVENAAGGFGVTEHLYKYFVDELGIDALTTGNHWRDRKEIVGFMARAERLLVPINAHDNVNPLLGTKTLKSFSGTTFHIMNIIGTAFMNEKNSSAFDAVDRNWESIPDNVSIRVVDFHGEAGSEKQAMGHYLAGRSSLVFGTHWHVQTADERILNSYTGFITDLGMTGPYDSVIGIKKESAIYRFKTGIRQNFEPATADPWFCGVSVDIDEVSGRCLHIERIRWQF